MNEMEQPSFDAPIAGQSLTAEVGARPWQNPPQHNTMEEAMEFYLDRFDTDDVVPELLSVIESGVSLATIANSMQLASVMQGIHSVDVGILVAPILIEMLKYLAEKTETEYVIGDEKKKTDKPNEAVLNSALRELEKQQDEDTSEEKEEPIMEEEDKEPTGLMARRA
jgi:hypothetical protein